MTNPRRTVLLLATLVLVAVGSVALLRLAAEDDPGGRAQAAKKPPSFVEALILKYGSKKYSQHNEELFIRDFFDDQKNGVFLDVGASHYRVNSTTYYLEKHLGWSGVAIDAIAEYRQGFELHRPRTKFFAVYVADKSDEKVDFYVVPRNPRLSSAKKLTKKWLNKNKPVVRKIQTVSLNDLLDHLGIKRIDFLSMDIELAEPAALAGFDIDRFRPKLVCIEANKQVLKQILAYFNKHNYVNVERYSANDPLNMYFKPQAKPGAGVTS